MSEVSDSITGHRWADRVLFGAFILLFGMFVLVDNRHPNRRDVAVFAVSALFWALFWLGNLSTVAAVLGRL